MSGTAQNIWDNSTNPFQGVPKADTTPPFVGGANGADEKKARAKPVFGAVVAQVPPKPKREAKPGSPARNRGPSWETQLAALQVGQGFAFGDVKLGTGIAAAKRFDKKHGTKHAVYEAAGQNWAVREA